MLSSTSLVVAIALIQFPACVVLLEPTVDLGFHMLVSCSWAVGMQSLQDSGSEEASSNSLTGLDWSSGEPVEIGVYLSYTSCSGGRGETNHTGSLTAGHMKLGLGSDYIS